jgi:1,4-alpha-glucan branching enzyme
MGKQVERLATHMDRPPLIVSPYDAELFGHWWFEGPVFLGDVLRQLHFDQNVIETITPERYLERHPTNQRVVPADSSWGLKGFNEQWLNESNAWIWPHLHAAGERMVELARKHASASDPLVRRALNQAARELMLAQSSDWPFIMSTGTTTAYATRRFNDHIIRFDELYQELEEGRLDADSLRKLESEDNLFPDIDYRIYAI